MNINSTFFKLLLITFVMLFFFSNLIALENKIIVKVNNEIITSIDIKNEINYLSLLNPQVKNLDKSRLTEIAKNSLIREKVKIIAILDIIKEIDIEEEYIDKIIKTTYQKIGLETLDQYKNYLKKNGLQIEYIKNKIGVETIWNEIIYKKFKSKIIIDKEKISNEVKNNPDVKLQLSEIIFKIKSKNEFEKKYNEIKKDIQSEGFENAALIHSISNSSSSGGEIGWIDKNSLNKIVNDAISNLKVGEHSKPILTASGFLILKINDIKRNVSDKKNFEKKINTLIRIKTNQQLNQLSNMYLNKVKKDLTINEL